ncbi:MAG: PcfJ domain-containing protein [Alphaproteobacteria bacterium]|nr:PcfJ domain-containing protein [Alphaproteobacteria bacterium]
MQKINLVNEKDFIAAITTLLYNSVPTFTPENLRDIQFVKKHKESVVQSLILQCLKKRSREYMADVLYQGELSLPIVSVLTTDGLPEWAQDNLKNGIKLFRYTGDNFPQSVIDDLTKARDFLYQKATEIADRQIQKAEQKHNPKKDIINLAGLYSKYKSFDAILDGVKRWHKEIEEKIQQEADLKKSLEGTEFLMDLPNGLKAYRLLTPEALDYESNQMRCCIGQGSYDKPVKDGKTKIYSLRDKKGQPHVTFEIRMNGQVEEMLQCRGKCNKAPVDHYLFDTQTFIKDKKIVIKADFNNIGLFYYDNEYYEINNLPEGLVIKGDLDVSGYAWEEFPACFSKIIVKGSFICSNCKNLKSLKNMPQSIGGNFNCSGCHNLNSVEGAPQFVGRQILAQNTSIIYLNNQYYNINNLPEGLVIKGDLDVSGYAWEEFPACFSKIIVKGSFICSKCKNLKSLKNMPQSIGGNFNCSHCPKLNSLEGVPQSISGDFNCSACHNLNSLEGMPQSISGDFNCSGCPKLNSVERALQFIGGKILIQNSSLIRLNNQYYEINNLPEGLVIKGDLDVSDYIWKEFPACFSKIIVKGSFICSNCKNLKSLKNVPQCIGGNFDCSGCPNLDSLEGSSQSVGGNFDCSGCPKLSSLKGAPQSVDGGFDCSGCLKLSSLEGSPQFVGGNFDCSGCPKLSSLKGAPQSVDGGFDCSGCLKLSSLEGSPQSVGGNFDCSGCPRLISLEGSPQSVGSNFNCSSCWNLNSLTGAPQSVGGNFNCSYCSKLSSLENDTMEKDIVLIDEIQETMIQQPFRNNKTNTEKIILNSLLNDRKNIR